jgi:WD40 repeat protein/serine/threonine protein kinase
MSEPTPSRTTPPAEADRTEAIEGLYAALQAELRQQWRQGQRLLVETLITRHPILTVNTEAILDLLYHELLLREERGEQPQRDEYTHRFPHLAGSLGNLFSLHQSLKTSRLTAEEVPPWVARARRNLSVSLPQPPLEPRRPALDETLISAEHPKPPAAPPDWPTVPGYEILGVLGRGGMGVVYQARQARLKRVVALKMILAGAHAAPEDLERFRREGEAVARLKHPNIVQIYDVGEHGGLPFFSLEYVDGGSLAKKLGGAPLPARQAAELVATLAQAVQAAHEHGIVHRDLKPANILLTVDGTPKITDFGLAKQLDDDSAQTQSGAILGTPSYMAPEQAGGHTRDVGPAADVYALGAILYDLLTGRPPFKGATLVDTLEQVRTQEPVAPGRLQPKVPRDLETICLKCLQKEPAQRYASAKALAEDLGNFLEDRPIHARPVSGWERTRKWVHRRPAVAALLATTAVVTVVGFVLVTWKWRQAEDAYYQADAASRAEAEQRTKAEEATRQTEVALQDARANLYLSNIAFAHREWSSNHVAKAEELLDACPLDLRRWEWYYLKRRCHDDRLTFRADASNVHSIAFSPDGEHLATAGGDEFAADKPGEVKVWDVATGHLRTVFKQHSGPASGVAFGPKGDLVASASVRIFALDVFEGKARAPRERTGEVLIWDWKTGKVLHKLAGVYHSVAFNYRGDRLVTAGLDRTVKVWDVQTGKQLLALAGHRGHVGSVAYSPDGEYLASTAIESTSGDRGQVSSRVEVKLWKLPEGKEAFHLAGHTNYVGKVVFSPDGRFLASAGGDGLAIHWDVHTGRQLRVLHNPTQGLSEAAFSPDGKRLATCGSDQAVRVWDVDTGAELLTLRGHANMVGCVAFAPRAGSAAGSLASAGADGMVKLWDLDRMPSPRYFQGGHETPINGIAYSPNGRLLVSFGSDRAVFWDAGAAKPLPPALTTKPGKGVFSPDGRWIVTGGGMLPRYDEPGELKIWDAQTHRELHSLKGHSKILTDMAFRPDGKRLASASGNAYQDRRGEVIVWNPADGKQLIRFVLDAGTITCLAYSRDGRSLALGSMDKTVLACDPEDGKVLRTLRGHDRPVLCLAMSPDGKRLASGDNDGNLFLWDWATGTELHRMRAHAGAVVSLAYSPDGARLASANLDLRTGKRQIKVWDTLLGKELLELPGHLNVAFSPDGHRLAASRGYPFPGPGQVVFWDAAPTAERLTLQGHAGKIMSVAVSADGQRLATAHDDRVVKLWDLTTGQQVGTLRGHTDGILGVAFGPDGQRLASVGLDGLVKIWDPSTEQEVHSFPHKHGSYVWGLAVSPDGGQLATASEDKTIKLWDARTGQEVRSFLGHENLVWSVAFSPDGLRLASASSDATVRLWDVATGKELRRLTGHKGQVRRAVFSPDGQQLASAGMDQTIKVWDLTTDRQPRTFEGHTDAVMSVAYSPDGRHLASCGVDRTVRIWDAATGRVLQTFGGNTDRVRCVVFSPDGRYVISSGYEPNAKVWEVASVRPD